MKVLALFSAAVLVSAPLAAQTSIQMPSEYKEVQVKKLEAQHRLLRAMADSMPERLYRDRATPAQRDFAEQIYHAASSVTFIAAQYIMGVSPPAAPDTARMLSSKTQTLSYLDETFRWAIEQLRGQANTDRATNTSLFGQNMPKWQVWDEIHQHTIWTAGQVVANFRKHGMAPPGFSFF